MNRLDVWLQSKHHLGIFLLRLFIGLRLIYGVTDNIFSWNRMKEFAAFLQLNGFPLPTASAVVSVYAQALCGALIIVGYKIRIAAAVLILNFLVAIFMVHLHDTAEGMTPALSMLFGCITFLFCGAGKLSFDKQ